MREIGELLRQTREEKGLSLKDAQVETKIRTRYLEALERGDETVVPGEVYFRGFLRTYANFLGLDGQELASRYRALKEAERASQAPPPAAPRKVARFPRALPVTALVLFLLAALFVAWWAWQSGLLPTGALPSREGPPAPGPAPGPTEPGGPGTPAPGGAAPGGPGTTPGVPGGGPGGAPGVTLEEVPGPRGVVTLNVQGASSLEVKASFRDRCWVRVTADGLVREETTYTSGQEKLWRAQASLKLRAGNAGAIVLSVNGVPVGELGGAGDVVDVIVQVAR
ncbi:MAG: RodZ domain-containing protein [Bacillota bacterium]|nr:DUF4115 domain-containing protein [Bacillota bacterium]